MNNLTLEEKMKMFPVLTYSRVCGWIVPYQSMNPGKTSERKAMKHYDVGISLEHQFNC